MLRYWQKALSGEESYCECTASEATHFCLNGGPKTPIAELNSNQISVENVSTADEEPLGVINLDFEGEKIMNNSEEPLAPPALY